MRIREFTLLTLALLISIAPAFADGAPKKQVKPSSAEAFRDLNIFQSEPSIINERYYTSGQAERHQSVGKVLPYGAEIPDNNATTPAVVAPPGLEKTQAEDRAKANSKLSSKNRLPEGTVIPDNK